MCPAFISQLSITPPDSDPQLSSDILTLTGTDSTGTGVLKYHQHQLSLLACSLLMRSTPSSAASKPRVSKHGIKSDVWRLGKVWSNWGSVRSKFLLWVVLRGSAVPLERVLRSGAGPSTVLRWQDPRCEILNHDAERLQNPPRRAGFLFIGRFPSSQ